ncbi:hypothetical protein K438DRAFT_1773026 [Mycena galopus ATCC 62051]|nr:hypothetical protein K438DRAFT_1773026 [Mycena galopus ATCC 62051]
MAAQSRNLHRNSRPTTKPANVKASTRRRDKCFLGLVDSGTLQPRPFTDRSRDEHTDAEIAAIVPWAKAIKKNIFHIPSSGGELDFRSESWHEFNVRVLWLHKFGKLDVLGSPITVSTGSQTPSGPSADLNSASNVSADLPDPFRTLDITLASASLGPSTTKIEPAIGLLLDPHPAPLPMLTLQFRHSEVPEPPILCFKGDGRSNLNELVILWTDEAGAPWHTCPKASVLRSRLPKIQGHPIAIKHWAHFIFEHWEKTPDDVVFWNGFSPNPDGQVQSLAQVSNSLRVMRTRQDAEDAASARTEYGDPDFKTNFIRHGSAGVVLTATDGVARRYRKLLAAEGKQNFDALAFKQQFSYIGRSGPSVMTNANDIASRYIQIRGDNSALRYDLN